MADPIEYTMNKNGEKFYIGDRIKFDGEFHKGQEYIINEFYYSGTQNQPCWNAEDGTTGWIAMNLILIERPTQTGDGWSTL